MADSLTPHLGTAVQAMPGWRRRRMRSPASLTAR